MVNMNSSGVTTVELHEKLPVIVSADSEFDNILSMHHFSQTSFNMHIFTI